MTKSELSNGNLLSTSPNTCPQPLLVERRGLVNAINALAGLDRDIFRRIMINPDYTCWSGKKRMMVSFRGQKVGGFSISNRHWYISKIFANDFGASKILQELGFNHVKKNETHTYWKIDGSGDAAAFESALAKITGVPI